MKPGWLIGIIVAFVLLSFVVGLCENAYVGNDVISKLDILMRPFMQTSIVEGIKAFFGTMFSAEFWETLWDIFWWDYPFFTGEWAMARYIFFIPLSIGFLFSLGLATLRGVSSG